MADQLTSSQHLGIASNRRAAPERLAVASCRPRCCMCCSTGKCVRCLCVSAGRECVNCVPSHHGRCQNLSSGPVEEKSSSPDTIDDTVCLAGTETGDIVGHEGPVHSSSISESLDESDARLMKAFGATLTVDCGDNLDDIWYCRWKRVIAARGIHYDLPGGATGRHFVDLLSDEVRSLSHGAFKSERLIVFLSVMLQREIMVKKGTDIQRLLSRRMSLWQEGCIDLLIDEYECCTRRFSKPHLDKMDEAHIIKVFTCLMWRRQVRTAVRWVTGRSSSGYDVLDPTRVVHGDKTGFDMLKEKHPPPSLLNERACLPCDDLPPLIDVDVTGSHVESVARMIRGGAGPGGSSAIQWQGFLLRYGAHSERLWDSMAELARHLANSIVEWTDIRAPIASRLIALDKCPGIRPIGIGEEPRRILGKVLALATRFEVA